jgi:polysaccharide biosynthesis/export protein
MRRIALVVCLAAFAAAGTGCSSLGISPPRYKLLPESQQFRDLATPPPALPRELAKTPLSEYLLEPGDALLIQPADFDSPVRIPADQPILPDGAIELGVYGRPVVAGFTVPQVEAEVARLVKAKEGKEYPIVVRLVGRQSKVYYVLGEVNSPGSFPLSGRETVLDGLMAAGGLTRSAQEKKVILVRPSHPDGCREVLPVCYPQIVQLGDTSTNFQLRPGDRIYVPSQGTLESFFPSRSKTSPPCCKPHVPCYTGGGGAACPPAGVPTAAAMPMPVPAAPPVAVPVAQPVGSFTGR